MAGDWASGHNMDELPPDPQTGERHFTCRNCDMAGHIDKNGTSSGPAVHQPCLPPKGK